MNKSQTAVVIANLGAPSNLSEVRPFLFNLFNDPDIFQFPGGKIGQRFFAWLISTIRVSKTKSYYAAAGGGSPLQKLTMLQAEKLEKILNKSGNYKVFTAQRYWQPFIFKVVQTLKQESVSKIVVLPLYPQYSTTSTQSIFNEWKRHSNGLPPAEFIHNFYHHSGFIKICAEMIKPKLQGFDKTSHLLFTAHSIPFARIKAGDPYENEINDQIEKITSVLNEKVSNSLCYQSKVGRARWLEPSFETEVDRLVRLGIKNLVVFPLSFVTENLETLYELDVQKKDYALSHGIKGYFRIPVHNDNDEFIEVLKTLVLEAVRN